MTLCALLILLSICLGPLALAAVETWWLGLRLLKACGGCKEAARLAVVNVRLENEVMARALLGRQQAAGGSRE